MTSIDTLVLGVFHFPVPHYPFVFDSKGRVRKPFLDPSSEEGYVGNLGYMDLLLGELMAELRHADRFDSSWLIVTSDHEWHGDPRFVEPRDEKQLTHVPLIIKRPFQNAPASLHDYFSLQSIGAVVFDGQRSAAEEKPGAIVSLQHRGSP